MGVISFTSDWNNHDYYAGMLKGKIIRMIPAATLVDISHDIQPFHSLQGAFVLRQAMSEFPEGTIHVFLVNQGQSGYINPVVCKYRGQYVLAWNDPVLGLLFDEDPEFSLEVSPEVFTQMKSKVADKNDNNGFCPSFPEMALFPSILKWITESKEEDMKGFAPVDIGGSPWQPVIQEGAITGRVIYIDSYKNAISNISRHLFDEMHKGRKFEVFVKSNHYRINELSQSYGDAEPGDLIALFNSAGFLEVAMVQARVGDLLSLEQGSAIKIKFYD